jgi:ABC-type Fe3+-hydroxamate transport system substrate-binding protein
MTGFLRSSLTGLLLALAVLTLVGCGSRSPSPSASPSLTTGVRGSVVVVGLLGQTSPQPQPDTGVVAREGDQDGRIVARTNTDSSGVFSFDLPPGTYAVELADSETVFKTVAVRPGDYADVSLVIHGK